MHKENAISWKSIASQYNQWVREAGVASIVADRPFGEIPLDRLNHTFGQHSLFLDEQAGLVGLYLGDFPITFEFIAERQSCASPSVISLPKTLGEAPPGLRDLYLAIGENFVGHNLGGRLNAISPHPDKAGEVIFTFDELVDQFVEVDQAAVRAGTGMFRQIWQVLLRASERTSRGTSQAGPGGGAAKAGSNQTAAAAGFRRKRGRSGQSARALPVPCPHLTGFFGRKASPISRSNRCSADLSRCF